MPTILDMDGVFVHSEWAKHIAEKRVFRHFGSEMSDEDILFFKGRTNTEQFSYAIDKYGLETTPEYCARKKLEFYRDYMQKGRVCLFHGFRDFYESRGGFIAVTTSSSRDEYEALSGIFGFRGMFPVVVTADDVEKRGLRGKPEPDPYLLTAGMLWHKWHDVSPKTEVFEDSTSGVYSAYDAGFRVVGITHLLEHSRKYASEIEREVDNENDGNMDFFDPGYSVQTRDGKEIIGLDNTNLAWAVKNEPATDKQMEILQSGRFRLIHHFYDLDRR